MRPTRPSSGRNDLFRDRLDAIINPRHALVRLSGVIPWARFDEAFGGFYRPVERPAKPTRLMVGLHYLKHVHDLSDEETVERWVENPYWQFLAALAAKHVPRQRVRRPVAEDRLPRLGSVGPLLVHLRDRVQGVLFAYRAGLIQ